MKKLLSKIGIYLVSIGHTDKTIKAVIHELKLNNDLLIKENMSLRLKARLPYRFYKCFTQVK